MPISAYIGSLGSGKSYEVVLSVIVPACLQGRRVVTNIYGINESAIHDYCAKKNKVNPDELGRVLYVTNDQVFEESFFPFKDSDDKDTFCQAGDLICIDECWRIWESDKSICNNHRSFIAEHRHFTHKETGVCCDLVVINQEISQLPRFIKARLDTVYRMQKHLALGLKSHYRVDVFTGAKLYKANKVTSYQRKYDKTIFPLYKSYETGTGNELTVDKRQNVFSKKSLYVYIVGILLVVILSVTYLVSFFKSKSSEHSKEESTQIVTSSSVNKPLMEAPVKNAEIKPPVVSSTWRIGGKIQREGRSYIFLVNTAGNIRVVPAAGFSYQGMQITGIVDNELVTIYSGGGK